MHEHFHIRPSDLCTCEECLIQEVLSPSCIDLNEADECRVATPIMVVGKLQRTNDWIFLEASIETSLSMPCAMCNEKFEYKLVIPAWRAQQTISSLADNIWDLTEELRETVVLEFPFFAMCGSTRCLNIEHIRPFLSDQSSQNQEPATYRPFQDLL